MHRIIACIAVTLLVCSTAVSERLRLPVRFTQTEYTVHTLTGLTSDERKRQKVLPSPIELKVLIDEDGKFVCFTMLPRDNEDESGVRRALLPYDKKDEMISALESAEKAGREAVREAVNKRTGIEETLFSAGDVSLVLLTGKSARTWVVEMILDKTICVLSRNHVAIVVKSLKQL